MNKERLAFLLSLIQKEAEFLASRNEISPIEANVGRVLLDLVGQVERLLENWSN